MTTAFAEAIDAIFADTNIAVDALWRVGGEGDGKPVRVAFKMPQEIVGVQDTRFDLDGVLIDVRLSEVPAPAKGDTVEIVGTGEVYDITNLSVVDSARLVQTCEAAPQ